MKTTTYEQTLFDIIEMLECGEHAVTDLSPLLVAGDCSRVSLKFKMCDMWIRVTLADAEVCRFTVYFQNPQGCLLSESVIDDAFHGELTASFILAFVDRVAEMGW